MYTARTLHALRRLTREIRADILVYCGRRVSSMCAVNKPDEVGLKAKPHLGTEFGDPEAAKASAKEVRKRSQISLDESARAELSTMILIHLCRSGRTLSMNNGLPGGGEYMRLSTSSSGYSRDRAGPSTRLCLARPRDDGIHDSESPEGEAHRQGEGTRHSQSYEVVRLRCLSQHRLISPSRSLSPERLPSSSARELAARSPRTQSFQTMLV